MATWTDIPDEVLEPGKPIRSVDALALRDNAIAIAEGAPNAPRIAGQQGPAVHTGGIANGAVTNVKIATMNASKLTGTINGARMPVGAGGVGTYAMVIPVQPATFSTIYSWNQTVAGSNLRTSNADSAGGGGVLSGTWRILSYRIARYAQGEGGDDVGGMAVRIS